MEMAPSLLIEFAMNRDCNASCSLSFGVFFLFVLGKRCLSFMKRTLVPSYLIIFFFFLFFNQTAVCRWRGLFFFECLSSGYMQVERTEKQAAMFWVSKPSAPCETNGGPSRPEGGGVHMIWALL